jgi:small subunit ribosomal protein S3Ae
MAQGKSKKNYGKKGQKKKVVDSLSRKEWFELKAPAPFQSESFGFTCANRTQGLSINSIYRRESRGQHKGQSRYSNAG